MRGWMRHIPDSVVPLGAVSYWFDFKYLYCLKPIWEDECMTLLLPGTRFVHTSEGRFLVTRLVPCPRCLAASQGDADLAQQQQHRCPDNWGESSVPSGALGPRHVAEVREHQRERKIKCSIAFSLHLCAVSTYYKCHTSWYSFLFCGIII